jgi:hypothetical protein
VNLHAAKLIFSVVALAAAAFGQTADPVAIMKRSVSVDNQQDELRRDFTYDVLNESRELDDAGKVKKFTSTKTEVVTLGPKRLRLLVARDGKPLPPAEAKKEREKYEKAAQEVARMSPAEKQRRMAEEHRRMDEDRAKFQHIPDAFKFTLVAEEAINGRPAWKIKATPIGNYSGPYAFLMRNMEGMLWIDKADYAWVKVEADTLGTVSFGWFLARIAKDSKMTFESTKVNDQLWAPSKISIRANARIALIKAIRLNQEITFSRYRKFQADSRIVASDEIPEQ